MSATTARAMTHLHCQQRSNCIASRLRSVRLSVHPSVCPSLPSLVSRIVSAPSPHVCPPVCLSGIVSLPSRLRPVRPSVCLSITLRHRVATIETAPSPSVHLSVRHTPVLCHYHPQCSQSACLSIRLSVRHTPVLCHYHPDCAQFIHPSVCPSVTLRYCVATLPLLVSRIESAPSLSARLSVHHTPTLCRYHPDCAQFVHPSVCPSVTLRYCVATIQTAPSSSICLSVCPSHSGIVSLPSRLRPVCPSVCLFVTLPFHRSSTWSHPDCSCSTLPQPPCQILSKFPKNSPKT